MKKARKRDVEKVYTKKDFIKKLRRFVTSLEKGRRFSIQVAGEKINIPEDAIISIEHEKGRGMEELEFQIKWKS